MIGRATDAEVEIARVAIRRYLGIPRHAEGGIREVREESDAAVDAGRSRVTR